jgi:peroxiredoxin
VGLPFPVLADEDRAVYRAYGLGRGSVWRVYGWRTLRQYWDLLRAGGQLERPSEDTLQLGGDFVVAPDGRLAYAFRSKGPDERPGVDELIRVVGNLRP